MANALSTQVLIRPAQVHDVLELANLGAETFGNTYSDSVPSQDLRTYLATAYSNSAVKADVLSVTKDIIVATDQDDRILGFAYLVKGTEVDCLSHIDSKVELQRLYIHPSAQNRGVGRQLAKHVEQIARKQGHKNLWLGVYEQNQKARIAYKRWGYNEVGQHDFTIGSVVQTDLILVKALW